MSEIRDLHWFSVKTLAKTSALWKREQRLLCSKMLVPDAAEMSQDRWDRGTYFQKTLGAQWGRAAHCLSLKVHSSNTRPHTH